MVRTTNTPCTTLRPALLKQSTSSNQHRSIKVHQPEGHCIRACLHYSYRGSTFTVYISMLWQAPNGWAAIKPTNQTKRLNLRLLSCLLVEISTVRAILAWLFQDWVFCQSLKHALWWSRHFLTFNILIREYSSTIYVGMVHAGCFVFPAHWYRD